MTASAWAHAARAASRARPAAIALAIALAIGAPLAAADDAVPSHRAMIDRVELEPAAIGGYRLRLYVSALDLQGNVLAVEEPRALKLTAARSEVRAPVAVGEFSDAPIPLAIAIVLQTTSEYADVLRTITDSAVSGLLDGLPDTTQIAVIPYGEAVGAAKLGSLKAARAKLGQLTVDGAAPEPALLDALDRALRVLKAARTEPPGPMRKLVVLISDGRDRTGDRDRITAIGKRAGAAGIRIHALAHAPNDQRRPLLGLGELSKRSLGTFRWLRKDATSATYWQPRFQQLRAEIDRQHVLTYFVDEDLGGKVLRLTSAGRTAFAAQNEPTAPAAGCRGEPCEPGQYCAGACVSPRTGGPRGVLGWLGMLLIGVIAVGVVLVGVGYAAMRRQAKQDGGAGPGAPPSRPPLLAGRPGPATAQAAAQVVPPPPGPSPAPGSIPPPVLEPTAGPRIYILAGPRHGQTLGLRHGFLVGAAPANDLVVPDGYTSGHHAQFGVDPQGQCWITDLGSTNGTFVNGVRVTQRVLDHGVTVRIGSTEIRFLAH